MKANYVGEIAQYLFLQSLAGKGEEGQNDAYYFLRQLDKFEKNGRGPVSEELGGGNVHLHVKPDMNINGIVMGTLFRDNCSITEKDVTLLYGIPETVLQTYQEKVKEGAVLSDLIDTPFCRNSKIMSVSMNQNKDRTCYQIEMTANMKSWPEFRAEHLPNKTKIDQIFTHLNEEAERQSS